MNRKWRTALCCMALAVSGFLPQKRRFVTYRAYLHNLDVRNYADEVMLQDLRRMGVGSTSTRVMAYVFFTDDTTKAAGLYTELIKLGYQCNYFFTDSTANLVRIEGETIRIKLDEATIHYWGRQMCDLGYRYDCDFDGWGAKDE